MSDFLQQLSELNARLDSAIRFEEPKRTVRRKEMETSRVAAASGTLGGGVIGGILGRKRGELEGLDEIAEINRNAAGERDTIKDILETAMGDSEKWKGKPKGNRGGVHINSAIGTSIMRNARLHGIAQGATIGVPTGLIAGVSGAALLNSALRNRRESALKKTQTSR